MIQVKEFINELECQESKINEWLQEMTEKIEVIDIKYSVSTTQLDLYNPKQYSGTLIIYKTK